MTSAAAEVPCGCVRGRGVRAPDVSSWTAQFVRSRIEMIPASSPSCTTGRWRISRPRHVIGGLGDVGLQVDGVEVRRLALGDLRGLEVAALGNEVHEVALGHDAGELAALEDHHGGDAVLPEHVGHAFERIIGRGGLHVGVHDVPDLHRGTSVEVGTQSIPPASRAPPGRRCVGEPGRPSRAERPEDVFHIVEPSSP